MDINKLRQLAGLEAKQDEVRKEEDSSVSKDVTFNNGYKDEHEVDGEDYFPNGFANAESPEVAKDRHEDEKDDLANKIHESKEIHKSLVREYRQFKKG